MTNANLKDLHVFQLLCFDFSNYWSQNFSQLTRFGLTKKVLLFQKCLKELHEKGGVFKTETPLSETNYYNLLDSHQQIRNEFFSPFVLIRKVADYESQLSHLAKSAKKKRKNPSFFEPVIKQRVYDSVFSFVYESVLAQCESQFTNYIEYRRDLLTQIKNKVVTIFSQNYSQFKINQMLQWAEKTLLADRQKLPFLSSILAFSYHQSQERKHYITKLTSIGVLKEFTDFLKVEKNSPKKPNPFQLSQSLVDYHVLKNSLFVTVRCWPIFLDKDGTICNKTFEFSLINSYYQTKGNLLELFHVAALHQKTFQQFAHFTPFSGEKFSTAKTKLEDFFELLSTGKIAPKPELFYESFDSSVGFFSQNFSKYSIDEKVFPSADDQSFFQSCLSSLQTQCHNPSCVTHIVFVTYSGFCLYNDSSQAAVFKDRLSLFFPQAGQISLFCVKEFCEKFHLRDLLTEAEKTHFFDNFLHLFVYSKLIADVFSKVVNFSAKPVWAKLASQNSVQDFNLSLPAYNLVGYSKFFHISQAGRRDTFFFHSQIYFYLLLFQSLREFEKYLENKLNMKVKTPNPNEIQRIQDLEYQLNELKKITSEIYWKIGILQQRLKMT